MKKGFLSLLILGIFYAAEAQVNTESFRKSDLAPGFYQSLNLDLSLVAGNSEYMKLNGGYRLDWVLAQHYLFGVVQYQRGLQNKQAFINKGFAHVRDVHKFNHFFGWEMFAQKEFNDFIALKDRNLIGGGLRTVALATNFKRAGEQALNFFIGVGLMWEHEKITTDPVTETRFWRSTNYFSARWYVNQLVEWNLVSYYQVHVTRRSDYRVLLDSVLKFNLTRHLTFTTSLDFRYDHEPPFEIKKYDLEMKNGVVVRL